MDTHEEQELDPNWVCCLLEDIPASCCDAFSLDCPIPWASHDVHQPINSSCLSSKDSCGATDCRKRVRDGSLCASSSRACREKMRRDRVNERFLELSAILETGKTCKSDKAATLSDAIQKVKMLHEETSSLKSQNLDLKQKIEELKAEKKELRDEKRKLMAEKERVEQQIKALGSPQGLQFRPTTATPSAYATTGHAVGGKPMPFINYPGVPLWHFVSPTAVDTSQDHVFHPPVA